MAEQGAAIVGAVLGRFDGRRGWVNHLGVLPSAQGGGVGSRLMAELERRLIALGCRKVNLHVYPDNSAVCPFYEGIGYRSVEMVFMEKFLPVRRAGPISRTGRRRPARERARRTR